MFEVVKFDAEKVSSADCATHPSLRHQDTPERIHVVIVNGDRNPNHGDLQHYDLLDDVQADAGGPA